MLRRKWEDNNNNRMTARQQHDSVPLCSFFFIPSLKMYLTLYPLTSNHPIPLSFPPPSSQPHPLHSLTFILPSLNQLTFVLLTTYLLLALWRFYRYFLYFLFLFFFFPFATRPPETKKKQTKNGRRMKPNQKNSAVGRWRPSLRGRERKYFLKKKEKKKRK